MCVNIHYGIAEIRSIDAFLWLFDHTPELSKNNSEGAQTQCTCLILMMSSFWAYVRQLGIIMHIIIKHS